MPVAFIGIGSNLGKREENCRNAIKLLEENGITVSKVSSIIETEPWGIKEQPNFINMAVKIETHLNPDELLILLKKIEHDLGRERTARWGPRTVDLDILLYEDIIYKTNDLEIPHPGIKDRLFVLKPLAEIAPDKIHPVLKKSISQLLSEAQ